MPKKTVTTTYEYDEQGRVIKEVVTEDDGVNTLPPLNPYRPYTPYWDRTFPLGGTVTCFNG